MSILNHLSSQLGERTEEANTKVASDCMNNHALLKEIASGLRDKNQALVGDCAEVFTKVAEVNPELVAPYAKDLMPLLEHKNTRVRWEAMHAIAFTASLVPDEIAKILSQIHRMSLSDTSTIVRDYSVIAISNYAKTGKKAAEEALVVLKRILEVWKEKQAVRALKGLQNVAEANPSLAQDVVSLVKQFENSPKATVKKAAKDVLKTFNK